MKHFLELSLVGMAGTGCLVAQTNGASDTTVNLIGGTVTIAVLAFYVLYDIRVRTPALVAAFAAEQNETRKAFTEALEAIRETFQKEQAASRVENRAEIAEWRKMVNEQMSAFRVAVHDVKNTAQAVVGQTELLVKKREQQQ